MSGSEALACSGCHVVRAGKLVGKPGHATCFGACHGAPPRAAAKVDPDRKKLCTACHAESQIAVNKFVVTYPPYTIDPDFNLAIGHKQHAKIDCLECHPATKAAPHARCAGCHDGTRASAMDKCAGCHPPAIGKPQPPELAALRDTVTAVFSHAKHAARGGAGKECTTCHARIKTTDDFELPRPTVKDCGVAGCHDGRAAFGTMVACTRCHDRAPDKFEVARPDARFRHDGPHAGLLTKTPCAGCHPLDPRGDVGVASHAPCVACHADDFGARKPRICSACHSATEPWRKLAVDRSFPGTTEFGATLDHRTHLKATDNATCRTCHALATRTTQLQMPRGHVSCTGAKCHAVTGGPAPPLSACDGCHQLALDASRVAKRAADPWSVRPAFDHATHRDNGQHEELACTGCHTDLAAAGVLDLPTPKKPTCAPCHDGRVAFSLTGTTCTHCHAGKAK